MPIPRYRQESEEKRITINEIKFCYRKEAPPLTVKLILKDLRRLLKNWGASTSSKLYFIETLVAILQKAGPAELIPFGMSIEELYDVYHEALPQKQKLVSIRVMLSSPNLKSDLDITPKEDAFPRELRFSIERSLRKSRYSQ